MDTNYNVDFIFSVHAPHAALWGDCCDGPASLSRSPHPVKTFCDSLTIHAINGQASRYSPAVCLTLLISVCSSWLLCSRYLGFNCV